MSTVVCGAPFCAHIIHEPEDCRGCAFAVEVVELHRSAGWSGGEAAGGDPARANDPAHGAGTAPAAASRFRGRAA